MQTYPTSAERSTQADAIAVGLNASKHKSPVAVLRALNISPTLAHQDIEVVYARGYFWAGTLGHDFAFRLGPTAEYAATVIKGLKLP